MSFVDELQKLEELRRGEALTDEEYAQAKGKLLEGAASSADKQAQKQRSEHLAEARIRNELARLDQEWDVERQEYYIQGRFGRRHLPTTGMGIGIAVGGGIFGLIWTSIATSITRTAPDLDSFGVASIVFPLFGVLFVVVAIGFGIYCFMRAREYEKAAAEYQSRREAIIMEMFK